MTWTVFDGTPTTPRDDPATALAQLNGGAWSQHGLDTVRDQVVSSLNDHGADLADRRTVPGHLTGSALVVDPSTASVAILLHRKLRRWLQPGGHADGDLDLARVALREATEETGISGLRVVVPAIDIDIHRVDHGDAAGSHLHLDLRFLVLAPPGSALVGNHESLDIRWVPLEGIADHVDDPGIVRMAEAGTVALESIS